MKKNIDAEVFRKAVVVLSSSSFQQMSKMHCLCNLETNKLNKKVIEKQGYKMFGGNKKRDKINHQNRILSTAIL